MKSLSEQMINLDRKNFGRVANGLPELKAAQAEQTAEIFNTLFSALRAAFPASLHSFNDQAEFNELRRQWALAFRENGVTTMEQVNAGLRVARRQERPFLPSPGQFVAWCREGRCALGITVSDVMTEYWKWQKLVFRYPSSEQYPWAKPVLYHICIELRHRSTEGQLSRQELEREAIDVLDKWERRVISGKPVPPIRRAIAAPSKASGPTPAEMLMAKYKQRKDSGLI
ncbi:MULTISPECIES: replication protein P [Enterobacter]|uniref:replication protein P n=1 Tax=Enterobacter TaxID=547 RepID=UPI0028E85986|nr:replication protein P [Enterobacter cloacae]WNT38488.1 replication protein P [Enterobacter cloacae]HDR2791797.1 phage replication protein [Enterobacter asburiae]HDR2797204.1 phage replication protein [Enterobacter asburiae]